MPINPNTRFILESKAIESAYIDCRDAANVLVGVEKASILIMTAASILSLVISILYFTISLEIFFLDIIFVEVLMIGGFFFYLQSSKNIATDPSEDEDIRNIIYGDKYAITEVNPEELANYTRKLRVSQGSITTFVKGLKIVTITMVSVFAVIDIFLILSALFILL